MATIPTQLPVPSEKPQDLKFNAGKIDEFVTSLAQQYIDRLGGKHYTIEGLKQLVLQQIYNLGWNPIGTFQGGVTVANPGDIVQDTTDDTWYRWDNLATLPKTVPSGSTPGTSGGTGDGKWKPVDVSDVLRKDLASTTGIRLVGGTPLIPVTSMPTYSASDTVQAWKDSVAEYGYVYFPGHALSQATYTIINTVAETDNLKNNKVIVDDGVILSFDYDHYALIKTLDFVGRCTFLFPGKQFKTTGGEVEYISEQAILNRNPVRMKKVEFTDCRIRTVDGDTFTNDATGTSSETATLFGLSQNKYTGIYAPIDIGETISGHIKMQSGTASQFGVILRCSQGWVMIYATPDATSWSYRVKKTGQSPVDGTPVTIPGGNVRSYSSGKATIGISLQSKNIFSFIVNGVAIGLPHNSGDAGEIYEVGIVALSPDSSAVARVTGLCSYVTRNGIQGKVGLNILIHGDSTAEGFISAFDKYLPQLIDGTNGTRSVNIRNKAVAGTFMRQALDMLKADGPGDAYIIIMCAGTNEGQANSDPDTFAAMIEEFVVYCSGLGRIPVWVEPWMWYSSELIGGAGQATTNYDGVAELREAGKRQMMKYGDGAICVTTTHQLPAPLPDYFNKNLDPLVRDAIHQSQLAYRLYAEIIASTIIDWYSKIDTSARSLPQFWCDSTATIEAPSSVSNNSINAKLTLTGFSNGGTILTLPRWCRPKKNRSFPVAFTADDIGFSMGLATVKTSGQVIITGMTSPSVKVYLDIHLS